MKVCRKCFVQKRTSFKARLQFNGWGSTPAGRLCRLSLGSTAVAEVREAHPFFAERKATLSATCETRFVNHARK